MVVRILAGACALFTVLAVPARSQSRVWQDRGRSIHDSLGTSIGATVDFDGDGLRDVVAGAPGGDVTRHPHIQVISSITGAVLDEIFGDAIDDEFGSAVASAGDIDGDGTVDFFVGAPSDSRAAASAGSVQIRSGATHAVLREFLGPSAGAGFGSVVLATGDLDGDGHSDVAVGCKGLSTTFVYSSVTGNLLWQVSGPSTSDFGRHLARSADVDGDGVMDVLIGSPFDTTLGTKGAAYLYSGANGTLIRGFTDKNCGSNFGLSVLALGDADGDGISDVVVANPVKDMWVHGAVWLFSGATGARLFLRGGSNPGDRLGVFLAEAGDIDHDGIPDIAASVQNKDIWFISGKDGGVSRMTSTATGTVGLTFLPDLDGDGQRDFVVADTDSSDANGALEGAGLVATIGGKDGKTIAACYGIGIVDRLGAAVAPFHDLDGDGWRDVLVGAPGEDSAGNFGAPGEVRLLSGRDGSELRRNHGTRNGDKYGSTVATIPDFDGDGTPEYAIGNSRGDGGYTPVTVEVRSGASGALIYDLRGVNVDYVDELPLAVGTGPSGTTALAVGYPYAYPVVGIYDMSNGALLSTIAGESDSSFGASIDFLGDVDGDGVGDWIVGAPSSKHLGLRENGSAYVVSGATGVSTLLLDGARGNDRCGTAVAAIGDLDGDGVGDMLVSAPNAGASYEGEIHAFSGATRLPLFTMTGSESLAGLGNVLAVLGDVNRDGVEDFASVEVSYLAMGRRLLVFSGRTLGLLADFRPPTPDDSFFGQRIARRSFGATLQIDPDAIPDLLVGDPKTPYGDDYGYATLFRLDDLMLQATPDTLSAGQTITLDTRGGPAGNLAALFAVAFDSAPFVTLASTGTFGVLGDWSVVSTTPPGLAGHTLALRSFAIGFNGKVVDSRDTVLTFK